MKTELYPQQIEAFQRDGWLIVEDFLNPDELAALDAAVTQGVEEMGGRRITDESNEHIQDSPEDSYYGRVFLQRLNLWRISATVRKYLLGPELGQMLCRLEGIDGIRVWHDQTLQKLPWDNPTSWHMDCLPGSHKVAQYEKKGGFSPNMSVLFEEYPELSRVEPVPGVMKAGTAGFHNGLMAHAAGPNMTPYPRRAMTCAYMPDGATFNGIQNILSDEYVEAHAIGTVLDDENQTPLVWKRGRD